MDAPKCRVCGKREWRHVCLGRFDEVSGSPDNRSSSAKARVATQPKRIADPPSLPRKGRDNVQRIDGSNDQREQCSHESSDQNGQDQAPKRGRGRPKSDRPSPSPRSAYMKDYMRKRRAAK